MSRKHFGAAFGLLLFLIPVFLLLNVCSGSVHVPMAEIRQALMGASGTSADIVRGIRLPRALAALLLGGALGLSGYLLQSFFHNPIAGPFILGISSGAKLFVALVLVSALSLSLPPASWTLIGAAFAGALLSMGFILLMARFVNGMSVLIIGGVMIGYICSAITDLVVTFAADADIVNLHNWSRGSFSGITWQNVAVMACVILPVLAVTFLISKPLSAYLLGESHAAGVGVNLRLFRILLVLLSSLLAACVTAFAGPVSFVGVAVPHLVKRLLRTNQPLAMIPACFFGGGLFCLASDLLARTLFAPSELAISAVTAVLGGPVVIAVLLRRKGGGRYA